jgi:hypothetical protein
VKNYEKCAHIVCCMINLIGNEMLNMRLWESESGAYECEYLWSDGIFLKPLY